MSIATTGPRLTDIVVPDRGHPFFLDQACGPRVAPATAIERLEQSLVDSLERAMLMIIAAGTCLFAAAFCRYGTQGRLAHDAQDVFGTLAVIAGITAVMSVLHGLSCLNRLFGEEGS